MGNWRECKLTKLKFSLNEGVSECNATTNTFYQKLTYFIENSQGVFTIRDLQKQYGLTKSQAYLIIKTALKQRKLRIFKKSKRRTLYTAVKPIRTE